MKVRPCIFNYFESLQTCHVFISAAIVKYIGKNNRGKHSLSRKAALEAKLQGGNKSKNTKKDPPPVEMSEKEVDVIAQAINGIENL